MAKSNKNKKYPSHISDIIGDLGKNLNLDTDAPHPSDQRSQPNHSPPPPSRSSRKLQAAAELHSPEEFQRLSRMYKKSHREPPRYEPQDYREPEYSQPVNRRSSPPMSRRSQPPMDSHYPEADMYRSQGPRRHYSRPPEDRHVPRDPYPREREPYPYGREASEPHPYDREPYPPERDMYERERYGHRTNRQPLENVLRSFTEAHQRSKYTRRPDGEVVEKETLRQEYIENPRPSHYPEEDPKDPSSLGFCRECDWKGYVTVPEGEHTVVRNCSCRDKLCPKCRGEGGYMTKLPSGNQAWKKCECQTLKRTMELFDAAKIPARFHDKSLDNFTVVDKRYDIRKEFFQLLFNKEENRPFKPGDPGIVLMGPPGVGKTHLMVGLLRTLTFEYNIPCRFQDFGLLLTELRAAYSSGLSEMTILQPLIDVPVLLLDDLGKGRNSRWELGVIDLLVSNRYNATRTTLITTNYTNEIETTFKERVRGRGYSENEELISRDLLSHRVGERIYSRLCEMCEFHLMRGRDFRRKLSKEEKKIHKRKPSKKR